jgi:hypothetical protein
MSGAPLKKSNGAALSFFAFTHNLNLHHPSIHPSIQWMENGIKHTILGRLDDVLRNFALDHYAHRLHTHKSALHWRYHASPCPRHVPNKPTMRAAPQHFHSRSNFLTQKSYLDPSSVVDPKHHSHTKKQ